MKPVPVLVLTLLLCLGASARAAEDQATRRARAEFQAARTHYEAGRHDEAVAALERAFALRPLPLLLRYIGDSYAAMGRPKQAIRHYRDYLDRAPTCSDRATVEQRIAELERHARPKKIPPSLMPTGKDVENPLAGIGERPATRVDRESRPGVLGWTKWTALAVGVTGLAMGITFNRLAASKADELADRVRFDCPASSPSCSGNPNLNRPVVAYSKEHYDLEQQIARRNAIAITSFVVGGTAAAAAAVLFALDHHRRRRARRMRVSVTPVLGGQVQGLAGEVSF
jgi:tetratricopeptide (TPR) repeat protein